MLELADKNFVIPINLFKSLKGNMDTINTEMKDIKKSSKIELL